MAFNDFEMWDIELATTELPDIPEIDPRLGLLINSVLSGDVYINQVTESPDGTL